MKQPVYYRLQPDPEKVKQYEALFQRYKALHDVLGKHYPNLSYINN